MIILYVYVYYLLCTSITLYLFIPSYLRTSKLHLYYTLATSTYRFPYHTIH